MKMSWYSAYSLLLFLLRTNNEKWQFDKNNFFPKEHSESYLITAMFKVLSERLRGTFTTTFWKIPCGWIFSGYGSTYILNFSSRLWQTSWNENRWRFLEKDQLHKTQLCTLAFFGCFQHNLLTFLPFDQNLIFHWSWSLPSASTPFYKD